MRASLRRLIIGLVIIAVMCVVISGNNTYGTVVAQTLADDGTTPMLLTDTGILVDAELYAEVSAGDSPSFMIYMRDTAELSAAYEMDWIERGEYVYEQLCAQTLSDQSTLIKYLIQTGTEHTSFWINNSIYVEGMSVTNFDGLLCYGEIESIEPQHIATIPEVEEEAIEADSISTSSTATVQPNLDEVNAPEVWAQGIDGSGIVVANIDTGVRYTHQTLVDNYRGNEGNGVFDHDYDWYDATTTSYDEPTDTQGHGTHTMGIMVGSSDTDIIGMATGAEWIGCKGCTGTTCEEADLLECAEFVLAPTTTDGLDADPDLRPNIVNNSWGDGNGTVRSYDDWFQNAIDSWQAAGIYPVFSAGNGSSTTTQACETVGNPARYGNVTAVGATSKTGSIYATYSVRGPSDQADTVNPSGYPYLKPQVVAPGTSILSASYLNDTSLRSLTGTSMAAPHVSGLIALMWQAAPCLIGDYATTENLLEQTANAVTNGLPASCSSYPDGQYPNNTTGWGEIDAAAAVEAARDYCGDSTLQGQITDQTTGAPISQAKIQATNDNYDISARTNSSGNYTLAIWPGTYTLSLSAYGYESISYPLTIGAGASETLNFLLDPLETYTLSGKIIDAETSWPLYTRVTYQFTDQEGTVQSDIVWTDPVEGTFAVDIPEQAECDFQIEAYVDGYRTYSTSFTAPSADSMVTYGLYPCAECTAPGTSFKDTVETFDSTTLPSNWISTGTGATWRFDDPGERDNETGGTGGFAIIDSDYAGATTINTILRSPVYDMSSTSKVTLSFKQSFRHLQTEIADVDVSINNGYTWINVYRLQGQDVLGPNAQEIDISSIAAGQPQVMVRFHYYGANDEWYWQIDDVHVFAGDSACKRTSGGLVVGQVYAIDTDAPLADAKVSNLSGYLTVTAATADVNIDDGFYTLFTPTGCATIQATSPYYDTASSSIYMSTGTTQEVNFVLGAPRAVITATSYTAVVATSQQLTYPLRIANEGTTNLEYEIVEQDLGSNGLASTGIRTERLTEPLSEDVLAAIETLSSAEAQVIGNTIAETGDSWQVVASLPEGRTRPAIAAVGQKVYVIGGSNAAGEKTNTTYCYDIASNAWTELGSAPITLDGADAAVIAGHIYIPGDADSGTTCVYDTFQNVWTIVTANNGYSARWEYATAVKGSNVYVLGGLDGSSLTNEVWILDTTTGIWAQSSSMTAVRLGFAAGWVDDTLVAAGGVTGIISSLAPLLTTELWNGSSWSYGASVPSDSSTLTRWSYMADGVGVDGLWLAGGPRSSSLGESDDMALYSVESNTWTVSPTLPTLNQARGYLEGAIAGDGYFYAIGGQSADGQTVYSTVERCYVGAFDSNSDWLSASPTSGVVAPGEEATVTLTLDATATEGIGTYHAAIAINTNDPLQPQVWVPITMTVASTTGSISFNSASTNSAEGYVRETAVHSILLTNTGQSSDYYVISIAGNTWSVAAPSLVGPLSPGESTIIRVSVSVPATADWRDTDTCTLTIQSSLAPTQERSVTLTSSALPPRMRFPLIYN